MNFGEWLLWAGNMQGLKLTFMVSLIIVEVEQTHQVGLESVAQEDLWNASLEQFCIHGVKVLKTSQKSAAADIAAPAD
jgi:hypothetical protein